MRRSNGSTISQGNISGAHKMKTSLNRSTMRKMETEKSKKRSNSLLSDGRIKPCNDIDKHYEKNSYGTEKKKKTDVDLQKMLIEQYQQSNALLAQNINSLLLLNQQAAANQISPCTDSVFDDHLKASPYTAVLKKTSSSLPKSSLNCSSLSKQIIDQARRNVNNCSSLLTTPTKTASVKHSICDPGTKYIGVKSDKVSHQSHSKYVKQSRNYNERTSKESRHINQTQVKSKLGSDHSLVRDKHIEENVKHSKYYKLNSRTTIPALSSDTTNNSTKAPCSRQLEKSSRIRKSHLNQETEQNNVTRKELGDITKFLLPQSEGGGGTVRTCPPLSVVEKEPYKHMIVSTYLSNSKSNLRSPSIQSPALIMNNILNARLPKTPPDPRLSTERKRRNSISNLSDSEESLLSITGNLGDSKLNDSFVKVRRSSICSDKSDISDKSNETKISKSPIKHDGPRLSISEYQKRRKDGIKTKSCDKMNIAISSPSSSVVDNSNHVIITTSAPSSSVQDQLVTANTMDEEYKKHIIVSTSPSSMYAPEKTKNNDETQTESNIIHPKKKSEDDDFFIPRKASNFITCTEKSTATMSDNVTEQRVLKHLSSGYSDGDGVEKRKRIRENTQSDTSLDIHKRHILKVGTKAEVASKTSKVRIDDDIEFEYQAFLKSIGVTLKTKVCCSKEKDDDVTCSSGQYNSKDYVAIVTTKCNLAENSSPTNVSPGIESKSLIPNIDSNSFYRPVLPSDERGTLFSSTNDTIMIDNVDLDSHKEPSKSSEITTISTSTISSTSNSYTSILTRSINSSAISSKTAVTKDCGTVDVYHKLFVEPLPSVKFSPTSNTKNKHSNLILPMNKVGRSLNDSNVTNQISQGDCILRMRNKARDKSTGVTDNKLDNDITSSNSPNICEGTNPVDINKSVKRLKNDSDVAFSKSSETIRDFNDDHMPKKQSINDDLARKNSMTFKELDTTGIGKYNEKPNLFIEPSLSGATCNVSCNISPKMSRIDTPPGSPTNEIGKTAAIVQNTDTENVDTSHLTSEMNSSGVISDGKGQKEPSNTDVGQFRRVVEDDHLGAVTKLNVSTIATNTVQKESESCSLNNISEVTSDFESTKIETSNVNSCLECEPRVSSICDSTDNLTLLIDCAKMCTSVSSSSENLFRGCKNYNTEQSNISGNPSLYEYSIPSNNWDENATIHTTDYVVPGLSKLEQLASVAMSESQGAHNGLPRSQEKVESMTSSHHASMIDLQFLIPPTNSGKPMTEDNTGKGNMKKRKRKKSRALTLKKRNMRVKSKRVVIDRAEEDKQSNISLPAFPELNEGLAEITTKKKSKQVRPRGSHSCERCGKHFTLARLLDSHIKRDHEEEESETKSTVAMETTPFNLLNDSTSNGENNKELLKEITEKQDIVNTKNLHVTKISLSSGKVRKSGKGKKGPLKNTNSEREKEVKMIFEKPCTDEKFKSLGGLGKEEGLSCSSETHPAVNNDSLQNVTSSDPALVKRTKSKREGKVGAKKNVGKVNSIDGEEGDGIANSIRNKIQKLLSRSEYSFDTVTNPTSNPEGIGKRQSKATLKGKAFMEELHSQKSRRKRSKPHVSQNPELKVMTERTMLTFPNNQGKEEEVSTNDNNLVPSLISNSLIPVGKEMRDDSIQSNTSTEKKSISCVEKINEKDTNKGAVIDIFPVEGKPPDDVVSDEKVKIANVPPKRKYKCKICSSEFWKEQNFTEHSLRHNQRIYDCYKCTETFTTMRALTKHLLIHEDVRYAERAYDCAQCGYKCETENQLIVHKKVHEIHTCTLCFIRFKFLKELNNHISKCHPESVEQVTHCTSCDQGFDSISEFRKHFTEIHDMADKQVSVAGRNEGFVPTDLINAEERKKGKVEDKNKETEDKKGLKSCVMDMKNENKIPPKRNARKAKEVIQRSRKVKMILRRDAALVKASSSKSPCIPTIDIKQNSTPNSDSNEKSSTISDANKDQFSGKSESNSVRKLRSHGKSTQGQQLMDVDLKNESEDAIGSNKTIQTNRSLEKSIDMELTNVKTMCETKELDKKTDKIQKLKLSKNNLEVDRVEAQNTGEEIDHIDKHKSPSRQNSREKLKSPKSCSELSYKSWKPDTKSTKDRDALKISIKSPSQERKLSSNSHLMDTGLNVKKNVDVSDKVLSEDDQKELIKHKVESAERTARMLIRNQRRSGEPPKSKRSRKNSVKMDFNSTDSLPLERIEPVKIKVQVKMSEIDQETTSFILTSPEHFESQDLEMTKKNSKRKEKRKSGRIAHKNSSSSSYKSRKRRKGNRNLKGNIVLGMEALLDENFSQTESDEISCLLPRDIDFDKEYDYKNRSEEKTFLTADDLMSSLMTLADCAVDAHMVEMKDGGYQENYDKIKDDGLDDVKTVDGDVREILNELTSIISSNFADSKINKIRQGSGHELPSEPVKGFHPLQMVEQGDRFTPTPMLDHDYSGNVSKDIRKDGKQDGTSEFHDTTLEHGYHRKLDEDTNYEEFPNRNSRCTMNSSEVGIECSNATLTRNSDVQSNNISSAVLCCDIKRRKDVSFNEKTCSKFERNDSRQDTTQEVSKPNIDFVSVKMTPNREMLNDDNSTACTEKQKNCSLVNSSEADNSFSLALHESFGSINLRCNQNISSQTVSGSMASEESGEDEDWLVPTSSGYAGSDVVIKTEDDSYDIDVQAADLNDISALNTPYEEIHNNGKQNRSSSSLDNFYSFENHVGDDSINDRILNVEPTDDSLDTNSVTTLYPAMIHKTVSDLIIQSGDTFYCLYCRRKYRKESSVKQHTLTHINSIKHPFKCLFCPSSFRKCSEYLDHKSIHLSEDKTADSADEIVDTIEYELETNCIRGYSPKMNAGKYKGKRQQEIGCRYCAMIFKKKSCYKLHLRNNHNIWHRNGKKFSSTNITCFKCDKKFSNRKALIRHEIFTHRQNNDDNRCLICGRTFLKRMYLKSHIQIHQGVYPYHCPQREKASQLYNHVTNHEKI